MSERLELFQTTTNRLDELHTASVRAHALPKGNTDLLVFIDISEGSFVKQELDPQGKITHVERARILNFNPKIYQARNQ